MILENRLVMLQSQEWMVNRRILLAHRRINDCSESSDQIKECLASKLRDLESERENVQFMITICRMKIETLRIELEDLCDGVKGL